MSSVRVPVFVGQLNVSWAEEALFSERYGLVPTVALGKLRLTWRKWRKV